MNQNASAALIPNAIRISAALMVLTVVLASITGAMGFVLLGAEVAGWAVMAIIFGGGLGAAAMLVSAYRGYYYTIVEHAAAMIGRVDAESEAVRASGLVQNVQARGHARITVNNAPAINAPQEIVRLVPVHTTGRLIDSVAEADLAAFVDGIFIRGHSQRAWMGQRLPTGRQITTFAEYDALIQPLLKAGIIIDRTERKAGKISVATADEAKEILGLPAKTGA